MKPKDFLVPAIIALALTVLSGLIRGFPLRFLEPILTIQMVGAPASLFPFSIRLVPLLIDLVFWFLLVFGAWWVFKSKSAASSKVILVVVLVAFGIFVFWQYSLHQKLSETDMSCGGDWSYAVKCPLGSSCRSLGQGPLAGGLCKPWLSSVFESFESQEKQRQAPSTAPTTEPTPSPVPTPPVQKGASGWWVYRNDDYEFAIEYPPGWDYRDVEGHLLDLKGVGMGTFFVYRLGVGPTPDGIDDPTLRFEREETTFQGRKSHLIKIYKDGLLKQIIRDINLEGESYLVLNLVIENDEFRDDAATLFDQILSTFKFLE